MPSGSSAVGDTIPVLLGNTFLRATYMRGANGPPQPVYLHG
jgi:hypothetical protein